MKVKEFKQIYMEPKRTGQVFRHCPIVRGGVIPFTLINNKLFFILGVDTKTGDLTDFGGGIRKKHNENPINGSFRELREETLGLMGHVLNPDDQYMISGEKNLMIFLYCEMTEDSALKFHKEFENRSLNEIDPEVISLAWVTVPEILKLIFTPSKMFKYTKTFLNENKSQFFEFLSLMGYNFVKIENEDSLLLPDIRGS